MTEARPSFALSAIKYARSIADQSVADLQEWLRIPSVSTDPEKAKEVRTAAVWLSNELLRTGMQVARVMETAGNPVVYARHIVDERLPTVLVYGHYDVQPPEPLEAWDTPPFDAAIVDGNIVARGASDDKGQVLAHVTAVHAYMATMRTLPVNLIFLIEGEEELGSPNLARFIEEHKEDLQADIVLVSDTGLFAPGVPSITSGLRGISYVEVALTGASRDLHSGMYGGGVENPASVLCRMLAELHDSDHRVAVPGFYDDVEPLTDAEREAFANLPFDESEWLLSIGAGGLKVEKGYTLREGISVRPTAEINGVWSGYTGEGPKTVLPAKASAKVSCRLVPNQDPAKISEALHAYFLARTPQGMKLEFFAYSGAHPVIVDTSIPAMKAAQAALQKVFGVPAHFTRDGGSIPVVHTFKKLLGLDTVLMGFGLESDGIHSPNEKFGIDRFHQGVESIIWFLDIYGSQGKP